jgi:hypothetical protein
MKIDKSRSKLPESTQVERKRYDQLRADSVFEAEERTQGTECQSVEIAGSDVQEFPRRVGADNRDDRIGMTTLCPADLSGSAGSSGL